MNKNKIKPDSALLIVDMQNDFVLPGAPACVNSAYETIESVKELLDFYRMINHPVFHVIREYRSDGSDIEITRYDNFVNNKKIVVPNTNGCKIVEKLQPNQID
jgi:nicotinamidase-related amidase